MAVSPSSTSSGLGVGVAVAEVTTVVGASIVVVTTVVEVGICKNNGKLTAVLPNIQVNLKYLQFWWGCRRCPIT